MTVSSSPVRRAISLIEILLVLSIVTFLLALLIPGLQSTRERSRRMMCINNLHNWGIALQYYLDDYGDYLPTEGAYIGNGLTKPQAWYNALPPYLGLPPYIDFPGANDAIRDLPNIHLWICPSKNLIGAYKSTSGKNQFHYGMNQVLDGVGSAPNGSKDTPGFPDRDALKPNGPPQFTQTRMFQLKPNTVYMFDIAPNSMAGTPRNVATMYQKSAYSPMGKFHGDYANLLFLGGSVAHCTTDDLVTDRDFRRGEIIWNNPKLYWGYPPP